MKLNPDIFKAYDIRGVFPSDLDEQIAYSIGRAFVTLLQVKDVVVGRDMRLSSPKIFDALTRGLMAQGADVASIGMVGTDQFYYACASLEKPGIMVTASHNPAEYSGFKMVRMMPHLLSGDDGIQDLRRIVEAGAYGKPGPEGKMIELDLSSSFMDMILGLIDTRSLAHLSVIADTGNGMVGPILARTYSRLPSIKLTGMYLRPDGSLPNHGLDPLQPENRAELQDRVRIERADVGFAFDGDGDRFFTIDDRGAFVPGDFLTALIAQYLLERYPRSKIVYDVRASWAVRDLVTAAGGVPLRERVGHAFFKSRMAAEGAIFGGEITGHYYFSDFFFADSGIIPSLIVLEMLSKKRVQLSKLIEPLEAKYFISGEINTRVSSDPGTKLQAIAEAYRTANSVDWMDGVSISFDDWHFNVRSSNTEPLLRLNLEARSKALMEQKRDEVLDHIRK
jgi:phosphomannomutase